STGETRSAIVRSSPARSSAATKSCVVGYICGQERMAPTVSQPGEAPKKRAKDFAEVRDWPGYFAVMVGTPARDTLLKALGAFDADSPAHPPTTQSSPFAIDLGCGEGRDTLELLRRGWRVLAIDGHPQAFDHLLPRVAPEYRGR